jgi:hypothetical protein
VDSYGSAPVLCTMDSATNPRLCHGPVRLLRVIASVLLGGSGSGVRIHACCGRVAYIRVI